MRLLIVINPSSGNRNQRNVNEKLSHLAEKEGYEYKIIHTEGVNDDERIEKALEEFEPTAVLAVGGDGTINLVASLLVNRKILLGIIPSGSANGLAYNLDIPNDIEKAFSKVIDNKTKPLDAILINDTHHCFHLSDTGMNARVVKRFEQEGSKGIFGYAKQLMKELFSDKKIIRAQISTPEKTKNTKAEMVFIANAKSFVYGFQINPIGKVDDGKFEIVVIKPYNWWGLIKMIFIFITGRLHTLEDVDTFSVEEATLNFKSPQDMQVDGEVVKDIRSLKVKIIPQALWIFN